MKSFAGLGGILVVFVAGLSLLAGGCNQSKPEAKKDDGKGTPVADKKDEKKDDKAGGHSHSEWWCAEHGIPEEECSMCQDKVAKEAKAKGDWCDKHDRAKSQCFICDPKLKEKFAAKYRAKYGKEPPPIEDKK